MRLRKRARSQKRPVDGLIFNSDHKVLDLSRRTVKIEIEKAPFLALRRVLLHPAFLLLLLIAGVIGGLAFIHAPAVRAETSFYPHACLGGWNGATRAEGVPDIADPSNTQAFTEVNSAVLPTNTGGEMFCGGFSGNIPPDTEPRSLIVTLSMAALDAVPSLPTEVSTSSDSAIPPSILLFLESTTTGSLPENPSSTSSPGVSPSQSSAPSDAPLPSDVPTPVPEGRSSFLNMFVATAFAADNTLTASSSESSSSAALVDATSTTAAAIAALSPSEPFVEVRYTFDGDTWQSLGTLDREHVSNASFSIPLPSGTSWSGLSHFQIGLRSLTVPDKPALYLDGMTLTVRYAEQKKELPPRFGSIPISDGAAYTETEKSSVIVTPISKTNATNIIFYRDTGGAFSYEAETVAHGAAPLSEYYAPLPGPGSYVMIEYDNDGGNFDCIGLSAEKCLQNSHFIARTDFLITDTAPSAADATIPPSP